MTTTARTTPSVIDLDAALDHTKAGHKAANLARLRHAGFLVPDGVVLSAAALDRARAASADEEQPRLTPEDAVDLLVALRRFGDVPLAVRSSGLAEDSPDASYAGLYTTLLNVHGADAVISAVHSCWESARGERVASYRGSASRAPAGAESPEAASTFGTLAPAEHEDDLPAEERGVLPGVRMAVLIQPMVVARAAGVAFSADPVTGERETAVVEAVPGLAEDLVSGSASPEVWVVGDEGPVRRSDGESVLDHDEAAEVAEVARAVAREFGFPQDVEWAIDEQGIQILQARGITALPEPPVDPVPLPVQVPPGYWMRDYVHAPVPDTPFTKAVSTGPLNLAARQMAIELGLLIDGLEIRDIGGWKYGRVIPAGGRDPRPAPPWVVKILFRVVPMLRRRLAASAKALEEDVPGAILSTWTNTWQGEMSSAISRLREVDLPRLTDAELRAHLADTTGLLERGFDIHFRLHGALAMALGELALFCRDRLGWDDSETLALLSGLSTKSTEPSLALARLADMAEGDAFEVAFEEFRRTYGCRALRWEVAEQNLEERPGLIRSLIEEQRLRGFDLAPTSEELARRRRAGVEKARSLLRDDAERAAFQAVLARAVLAYPAREDNEFFTLSAPFGLCRRAALEVGRRLARRGLVHQTDDVFYLTPDEADKALRDASTAQDTVRRRRGERAWALAHPGPPSYGTKPPEPPLDALPLLARRSTASMLWSIDRILGDVDAVPGSSSGGVAGTPASSGSYTGPARVVLNEGEFDKIRSGDVLVCPVTSPVWSVVFPSVGALVTDGGGILSHPAIIAREYGIPAVVDTKVATSTFRDGDLVIVDGDSGIVSRVNS